MLRKGVQSESQRSHKLIDDDGEWHARGWRRLVARCWDMALCSFRGILPVGTVVQFWC